MWARLTARRYVIPVLVAAILVLGAGIGALFYFGDSEPTSDPRAGFEVHTAAEPSERQQATQLTASLSKLPDEVAQGRVESLSPEAQQQLAEVSALFPPGTTITVDVDSWRRTGTVASVSAAVHRPGDPAPTNYLLVLIRDGDRWLLSEAYIQQPSEVVPS